MRLCVQYFVAYTVPENLLSRQVSALAILYFLVLHFLCALAQKEPLRRCASVGRRQLAICYLELNYRHISVCKMQKCSGRGQALNLYQKLFIARALPKNDISRQLMKASRYTQLLEYSRDLWYGETDSRQLFLNQNIDFNDACTVPPNHHSPVELDWMSLLPETDRPTYAHSKHPLSCNLHGTYCGSVGNEAAQQTVLYHLPNVNIPLYTVVKDAQGFPINPLKEDKGSIGVHGRGVLGCWGANHAGDALITRFDPQTKKLQILLIERSDGSETFAFPGGFINPGEFQAPIKAVIRELLEEAIGVEAYVASSSTTTKCLQEVFGDFKWDYESGKVLINPLSKIHFGNLVFAGVVEDERNTDNAWIETMALHWHLNETQAQSIQLKGGDDAKPYSEDDWFEDSTLVPTATTQFYDIEGDKRLKVRNVNPLENLFASHSKILRRMLELYFPNLLL